jgi:hypothetical protein
MATGWKLSVNSPVWESYDLSSWAGQVLGVYSTCVTRSSVQSAVILFLTFSGPREVIQTKLKTLTTRRVVSKPLHGLVYGDFRTDCPIFFFCLVQWKEKNLNSLSGLEELKIIGKKMSSLFMTTINVSGNRTHGDLSFLLYRGWLLMGILVRGLYVQLYPVRMS